MPLAEIGQTAQNDQTPVNGQLGLGADLSQAKNSTLQVSNCQYSTPHLSFYHYAALPTLVHICIVINAEIKN